MALNPPLKIDRRGLQPLPNFDGTFDTDFPLGNKPEPSVDIADLAVTSKTATSVTLGWTGIDEVTALERATSPGSFTEIQSGIAANSTEVSDSTVSASTEYHYRLTFASGTSNTVTVTTNASVAGDWVVYPGAANDWRSPIPDMVAVCPRPDAETQSIEYHRNYHGSLDYDVLIDVMFGRWPYRYEIIEGPAGATIGNEMTRSIDVATGKVLHKPGPDYGRVKWTPNGATGVQNWTVRVTDQKGSTMDVVWTSARNDAAYIEVDSVNGSDANTGAVGDPLKTFAAGVWKNDDEDTTYAGKIVVFTGPFDINAGGTLPTSPALDADKKPIAYVATGSTTFNQNEGHWRVNSAGNLNGFLFKGINFTGSRTDLGNNRIFNLGAKTSRFSVHDSSFDNVDVGSSGADNPACIFFGDDDSNPHEYISIVRNQVKSLCKVQLAVPFHSQYSSYQLNSCDEANIPESNGNHLINIKDDSSYVCVRANTFVGSCAGSPILFQNQNTAAEAITTQECSYNRLVYTGNQSVDQAIGWNLKTGISANNMHDFANTAVSTDSYAYMFSSIESGTVPTFTGCLTVGGVQFTSFTEGTPAPVELLESDFDSQGNLTGSARTTYLGALGSEIAGESA